MHVVNLQVMPNTIGAKQKCNVLFVCLGEFSTSL